MSATPKSQPVPSGTPSIPQRRHWSRKRARAAIERLKVLHQEILERRGGEPIDVDSALDELRGREV